MAIQFEDLRIDHLQLLNTWLSKPHVTEFWDRPAGLEALKKKYFPEKPREAVFYFIAKLDSAPVGFIQAYIANRVGGGWWPEEEDGTFGVDFYIGEESALGRGLGSEILKAFVTFLRAKFPEARRFIVDPRPDNPRAIRTYEKAGFVRRGEISTPDGPAVLLELK